MRPIGIVIACILLTIGCVVLIGVTLLSGSLHHEARAALGSPLANVGIGLFGLACAAGIWRMKRWALVLYVAASLAQVALVGLTFVTELPLVVLALVATSWSELTW